jgi:CO dehydrogenase maturation factor
MATSIAVAGKGGTGKTTVAALLVSRLRARRARPILAVDADPDSNLAPLLGVAEARSIGDLREEVRAEMANFPAGMSKASYVEAGLHQIIEEAEGFDLLTMGRGEGAGCYCYLNSLIKKFSDDLTPSYEWVIMDNEAGLEHISRRTSTSIDTMLIVVTENPLSFHSALKIRDITDNMKERFFDRYVVTNMIRDKENSLVYKKLPELGIEHIRDIPYDPQLEEIVFNGEPVSKLENGPAVESIDYILDRIQKR